jgi:1-phosphofructokinase
MIVTVSPNPSLDRTLSVEFLKRGVLNRSSSGYLEPSGKGVNVAVALNVHEIDVVSVLPVGGVSGFQLVRLLGLLGVPYCEVPIAGEIRSNISLVEPDGTVTKVNEAGPTLSESEALSLVTAALNLLAAGDWLVASGALPAGAVDQIYPRLVRGAHAVGAHVAIDTSGDALLSVIAEGPAIIKPNLTELADAAAMDIETIGDVVVAAEKLRAGGARAVLASLGADGAVLVDDNGRWYSEALSIEVISAVGAGDALLAGFIAADGTGPEALAVGMAWAASAARQVGTLSVRADSEITIDVTTKIDFDRKLKVACRLGDAANI